MAGDGREEAALRRMAGPTVEFVGRVDDQRMRGLYARCTAFILPSEEDFGITALEAMAVSSILCKERLPVATVTTPELETPMKIAIVHDQLYTYGGAERVLKEIVACYPDADIYALFDLMPESQRAFLRRASC